MDFENTKKRYLENLYQPDKSHKGNVDTEIRYLVDYINSLDNYYTTSSCAGRIVILEVPPDGNKRDANWLFTSHSEVEKIELNSLNFNEYDTWFKQESFILHIAAKTYEDANEMLTKARNAGFKRSGIISTSKRFILEIMGTDRMTTPIFKEKLLIDQEYMNVLLYEANKRLRRVRERVEKFYELLK